MKKQTAIILAFLGFFAFSTFPVFSEPTETLQKAGSEKATLRSKTKYFAGDIYDLVSEGKRHETKKRAKGFKGDIAKLVQEGNALYAKGKYDAATEVYLKAHAGDPTSQVVNFNLGCVYYKRGTYDSALGHFHEAYRKTTVKTKGRVLFNVGNTYFKQGDYTRAMQVYIEALKLDPGNKAAKHNLEMCLVETQRVPPFSERLTADDMLTEETAPGTHTNTVSEPEENLKFVEKHLASLEVVGSVGGTTESLITFDSQYKDMTATEIEKIMARVQKEDIVLLKEIWRSKIVFSENITKDW